MSQFTEAAVSATYRDGLYPGFPAKQSGGITLFDFNFDVLCLTPCVFAWTLVDNSQLMLGALVSLPVHTHTHSLSLLMVCFSVDVQFSRCGLAAVSITLCLKRAYWLLSPCHSVPQHAHWPVRLKGGLDSNIGANRRQF